MNNQIISQLVLFGGIFIIFYFFMIRPQIKRQKAEKKFRDNLKKDDKIITIGGVHGRIVSVEENSVIVEIDKNVNVRFEKSAIRSNAQV